MESHPRLFPDPPPAKNVLEAEERVQAGTPWRRVVPLYGALARSCGGAHMVVCQCDYDKVVGYAWRLSAFGYAISKRYVLAHRLIMGCSLGDGRLIDHIDGNRLNNDRANLRDVTHLENMRNRQNGVHRSSKGRYRGVCYAPTGGG